MVFTFTHARKLNPEEVNPFSGLVSKALQGYSQGMHAAYLPQQIEADIFAKKIGPLATLATTPAFLQNPQFQAALGQIISKHLNYGNAPGGQGGMESGNGGEQEQQTYAGQVKKDFESAKKLAQELDKGGKVKTYISSAGGGLVNYLGDVGKKIIGLLPGEKTKEFVNPALAAKQHQFDTYLQGLKTRAIQTQQLTPQKADEVFTRHEDENNSQILQRISSVAPGLFQQSGTVTPMENEEAESTQPQGDQNTAVDVEEENDRANRDLTFASQLSEQIKAKTGHEISPDLIYNYMQRVPGKISIPLLLKAAGVK